MTDRGEAAWEIGVDIGGTFTDVVCRRPGGPLHVMKVPTSRADPSISVLASLEALRTKHGVSPNELARFAHGTTVATNAVLERKGAKIGLITTKGFRDVLEIGRQSRRQMYDVVLRPQTPVFLAPGRFRKEVTERISATGEIVTPLDEAGLRRAADELVADGVEAIAIVFLFSFANPVHEQLAKDIIQQAYPDQMISVSHAVDQNFREYERTVATAFDAYLKPAVDRYLARLEDGLARSGAPVPLQVMQSRGGLTSAAVARSRPVRLFLSGPAGGVVGGRIVGASAGDGDLITIDVGGTSADIALISRRKPLIRSEGDVAGFLVRTPMVDVNTIGSGGGSIARVDAGGGLKVGPQSAGSEPGPACYGRGGTQATVCDASVVLGYLDPDYFAGGTFRLDAGLAFDVVEKTVARPLGLSVHAAALGIHRVLNAQMAEGIRQVSVRQGIDPRSYALVPLGGAGGLHATALASELGIRRVIVPRLPGVLAAAGLLAAPIEHEVSAAFASPIDALDVDAMRATIRDLDARASELMRNEHVASDAVTVTHSADMCFIGQSYTLEIPFDPSRADVAQCLYEDFLVAHDRVYGHAFRAPAKITAFRAVHQAGGSDDIAEMRLAPSGTALDLPRRQIHVAGIDGPVEVRVLSRSAMTPGFEFKGPAIVQQSDTTTLVEPGWSGRVDEAGNLILEREGA
ncbi:hydantoinase/oxoprolinase family protein [Pseudorhodoplanes sp.]|uniref:hydantoinase/oxoprolinase family protein n=1 Tax=Pseudorhodoplanes sp. TaxID=1934341 RepID=UPI002B5A2461|nr:hydantoinase/oxoprolinase family protein [Pseudorhodoplanes sp.]HWV41185.1 hydantoinase/oxoprolinase family protein [Pseudorhodoplanes sp.]